MAAWLKRQSAWLGLVLCLWLGLAWADGFSVQRVHTYLAQDVYRLDADLKLEFSPASLEAMRNGVPLTLELEMRVRQVRDWVWDEDLAHVVQRYRLEYHALSGQYLLVNLNSSTRQSYPTLGMATDRIARIRDFPLLDRSLLQTKQLYYGELRLKLDIESLPAPLRPLAYISSDWWLSSEWYRWAL